jgi:putative hydrolase of the HAD superfamily
METNKIKTLFLDIGNVILSNGWEHEMVKRGIEQFHLDEKEVLSRHQLVFDNYEVGRVSFDEYLDWVIFYQPRNFSKETFQTFIFEQSIALDGHLVFFKELKQKHQLKVFAVSNEGRELNEYRINKFGLDELFDGYISSCYTGLHKPSKAILQLACDIAHTAPGEGLYVDDRKPLVEIANAFGMQTLHFQNLEQAKKIIETCIFHK